MIIKNRICTYHHQLFCLLFFLFLFFLFLFCPCAPICIIYSRIFKKRCKYEHKAHDQVDIYGLYIGNSGKRRTYSCTYSSHCKHSCDTYNGRPNMSWGTLSLLRLNDIQQLQSMIIFNHYIPKATLALVASWLIQKDTQDNITIKIDGRYVWNTKYPMLRWSLNDNDNRW